MSKGVNYVHKLSNFRKELDKTLVEMASDIGVSKSYYEKIEANQRNPSYCFINKFKKAFPDADINKIFFAKNHTESVGELNSNPASNFA